MQNTFLRNIGFRLQEEEGKLTETEVVGLSGTGLEMNTEGREGTKCAQKSRCDAGQRLSHPSDLSLVGVRRMNLHTPT